MFDTCDWLTLRNIATDSSFQSTKYREIKCCDEVTLTVQNKIKTVIRNGKKLHKENLSICTIEDHRAPLRYVP